MNSLFIRALLNRLRNAVWHSLRMRRTLRSGIQIEIQNQSDWILYNDIFVEGEYDLVIHSVLSDHIPGSRLRVMDLGANVGFFIFRFIDIMRTRGLHGSGFEFIAVEGSPHIGRELIRRLEYNKIMDSVQMLCGLVGRRSGFGYINSYPLHCMQSVVTDGERDLTANKVAYVDLAPLFSQDYRIDLLKCDIEGSELEFLKQYEMNLENISSIVMELHHDKCDTNTCEGILKKAGFTEMDVLREVGSISLKYFRRQ